MQTYRSHWVEFCDEIKNITAELEKYVALRHFSHSFVTKEGEYFYIANNNDYPNYHFVEKQNPPLCLLNFDSIQSGMHCLSAEDDVICGWPEGTISDINARFKFHNIITMRSKFHNFMDSFIFSLDMDNAISFFFNNQNLFQQFIFYYKDSARDIINQCKLCMNKYNLEKTNDDR